METEKQRGNVKGPTTKTVAHRVREHRKRREMDLAALSSALEEIDWPIPVAALSRLENENRRIDVDDVMSLAVALNVSPLDLLLPPTSSDSSLPTGLSGDVNLAEVWAWARKDTNLTKGARTQYWQDRIVRLTGDIATAEEMAEHENAQARAWALRQKSKYEIQLAEARERLQELASGSNG